ncbi:MAG: ATPase, partial [Lachnospiraceae bacterium]|nr:ATPase [Lachnospiraceae bacterium]
MTLTVKLLLIAALVLGIIVPFGYYLIGEKTKKRYKRAIVTNAFFYFGAFAVAAIMMFGGAPVEAAEGVSEAASNSVGFGYLAAALSTGLSCVGGG